MALEEEVQEDEDCIVRDAKTGEVFLRFNNPEDKQAFLKRMIRGVVMLDEGYKCGQCAAYPCFRHRKEEEPAGLCFQPLRLCRQECDSYSYKDAPARGGICKKDNQPVAYCQECHIPEMRSKIKK